MILKCGLRNLPEELVLSQETAKDCERFHVFFLFFLAKSSFMDTLAIFQKSETTFSKQFSLNILSSSFYYELQNF